MAFPAAMDPDLKVAIEVEGVSEWEWPAAALAHKTIIVPFAFRRREPLLRIFFRGKGIPMQGMTGPVSYYGTLRSMRIWNVV